MTPDTARHLVLVGLMGAGKTTVGTLCAQRLARDFVDTDQIITAIAGRSVAEIFASEGEAGFRRREREAVSDACAAPKPSVIACGGGAILDADNRRVLRAAGTVVWLHASPRSLAARVDADAVLRPLLAVGDTETELARLAMLRESAYRAASDFDIDTDDRDVANVADAVIAAFSGDKPVVQRGA